MHKPAPGPLGRLMERLRGRPIVRDLGGYRSRLAAVKQRGEALTPMTDDDLRELAQRLRTSAQASAALEDLTIEGLALTREVAHRVLGLRPYPEQLLAGLVLIEGNLAEMATGEGKTLAAVAPAWLHGLAGRGAHILTFNDYLARRDAAWMGPVFEMLGSSVGVVQEGMPSTERRRAYAADVTYATAKEAGFDYLRGFLAHDVADLVHRPFHYAIVDEADSILIDEARVPLVIAGHVRRPLQSRRQLAQLVETLNRGEHFDTDEHERSVQLTDPGYARLEAQLKCGRLIDEANLELLIGVNNALHARVLLHRDVDYIVRGGRIELIDELTGRVVEDRHLPDDLQAAVEAKEQLTQGMRGQVLGSVTLQHFLTQYPCLAGMTATAASSAEELDEFYSMTTVVVPPHRPSIRIDHPDSVFTHHEAKTEALVQEISQVHTSGRPVLVGTVSVAESEQLAARLQDVGVECEVLNAKHDDREAQIIAEAGRPGAVTISTNMAGRGTDIRLGGSVDSAERQRVVELGGLYVIGTNRHESQRVDDQLRGRAGRQGDPGSTRFFVSLEDPLIRRFGVNRLIPREHRPAPQDAPLEHPLIHREVARVQRIVEGENLDIRRTTTKYSAMVEQQRAQIHNRRQRTLIDGVQTSVLAEGAPDKYANLVSRYGKELLLEVERKITLAHADRLWREHLAHVADLRESIHLMNVARLDPLAEFQKEIIGAWSERWRQLDLAVVETFQRATIDKNGIDLEAQGLKAPTST